MFGRSKKMEAIVVNQYEDFEEFLLAALKLAENKHQSLIQNRTLMNNIEMALHEGWEYFVSITSVIDRPEMTEKVYSMLASNTWLARITLGLGAITPLGGSGLVMNLQKHREIPVAIRNVGLMYKDKFDSHKGEQNYLDELKGEVSMKIVRSMEIERNKY